MTACNNELHFMYKGVDFRLGIVLGVTVPEAEI